MSSNNNPIARSRLGVFSCLISFTFALVVSGSCVANETAQPAAVTHAVKACSRKDNGHRPANFIEVTEQLFCGASPPNDAAFVQLANLGIKTLVSVDGYRPNVEVASRYGLRYVHIPIDYGRVSEAAELALLRLIRDAEGPFFIHCHHGRHRGPTAAAIAGLASGQIDRKQAIKLLTKARTSRRYSGLWASVENYQTPPSDADLPELVLVAELDFFPGAMARIDLYFESLLKHRQSEWSLPIDGSNRNAGELADLIREGFRESLRHLPSDSEPILREWLAEAEQASQKVADQLGSGNQAAFEKAFLSLSSSCNQCHSRFRD